MNVERKAKKDTHIIELSIDFPLFFVGKNVQNKKGTKKI